MIPRSGESDRELKEAEQEFPYGYQIIVGVVLVGIGILLGHYLFSDTDGYSLNLFTEFISICVTIFVLNTLAEAREKRRELTRLKTYLIARLGSEVNDVARSAAEELRLQGWLSDGSLRGAYLGRANLQNAPLWGADLRHANFEGADLRNAILSMADLRHADFSDAKLQGVNFSYANLVYVESNEYTEFDESTTMPDDRKWFPEVGPYNYLDMRYHLDGTLLRFADPEHPKFWPPRKWGTIPPRYWEDN